MIDAVVPEALAERVNTIYRLISQKADAKKKLNTASQYAAELQEDDESILLHGHRREVFGCTWHPSCNIVATGYFLYNVCLPLFIFEPITLQNICDYLALIFDVIGHKVKLNLF